MAGGVWGAWVQGAWLVPACWPASKETAHEVGEVACSVAPGLVAQR